MSALSIRGFRSVFELKDGTVPFGLMATYSGAKLLPVTKKKKDCLVLEGHDELSG